jgi:hypothetical protein
MERKVGQIKCWNCGRWINRAGHVCPFCGKNKAQSRQIVEVREDRFITRSILWLIAALLAAGASGVFSASPWVFCGAGLLLAVPGLIVMYFWTGMAGA